MTLSETASARSLQIKKDTNHNYCRVAAKLGGEPNMHLKF